MALTLQLLLVGSLARLIFRKIFIKESHNHAEFDEIQREDEEIVEVS